MPSSYYTSKQNTSLNTQQEFSTTDIHGRFTRSYSEADSSTVHAFKGFRDKMLFLLHIVAIKQRFSTS